MTTNTLTFAIAVVHPCASTAIAAVMTNPSGGGAQTAGLAMSTASGSPTNVENGKSLTINFTEAVVVANTNAGINICGTMSYKLCTTNDCSGGSEILGYTVAADTVNNNSRYNLVLSPNTNTNTPAAIGALTVYFVTKITASAYTGAHNAEGPFYYTITAAVCDCS